MLNRLLSAGLRRPFPKTSPIPPRESLLVFAAALLVFFIASALRPVMLNADYLFFAETARAGTFLSPRLDAHTLGLYPAGYFRLLSLLFSIFPSELFAGKALSIVCAAASTTLLYLLVMGLFGDRMLARVSAFFLLLHPSMWFWAAEPALDWPWLALTLGALLFLLREPARAAHWLGSGALAGLAWQFRYTTQFLLPVVVIVSVWRYRVRHPAPWLALALWLGAFAVAAGPQMRLSQRALGGPFTHAQGMNVLFYSLYFTPDATAATWLENWPKIPPGLSTWDAIRMAPGPVAANFARNLGRFARDPWVLPFPLSLLILVGAVRLTRRNGRATALLLWPAACYLAGIALVCASSRFLLPLICLLAPVAMAAFLPRQGGRARTWHYPAPLALSLGLLLLWTPDTTPAQRAREKAIPAVAATLAEHGVETARVVVSSDPGFYFVEGGRLAAYRPLHPSGEAPPASPDEAAAWLERQGARFLVLESMNVPALAPGLAPLLSGTQPPGLKLLLRRPPPFECAVFQLRN